MTGYRINARRVSIRPLLAAACLLCRGIPAFAHHSFAAEFDTSRPVAFTGTVLKVELVNPHSWIHLRVTAKNGKPELWLIEGANPTQLQRRGFSSRSLPLGSTLQVQGYQARDGSHRAVGATLRWGAVLLPFQPAELPKPLR